MILSGIVNNNYQINLLCCHCIDKLKYETDPASPMVTMDTTAARAKKLRKMIVSASSIHEIVTLEYSELESHAKCELERRLQRQEAREQKAKQKKSTSSPSLAPGPSPLLPSIGASDPEPLFPSLDTAVSSLEPSQQVETPYTKQLELGRCEKHGEQQLPLKEVVVPQEKIALITNAEQNVVSEEKEDLEPKASKFRRIEDISKLPLAQGYENDSESCKKATDSQQDMKLRQPEKQPRLLRPGVVKHLDKALQLYQEVQQDVKIVDIRGELKDPDKIICAKPKHGVSCKDRTTKGLIMVICPSTLDEAVKVQPSEASGESRYYHQVQAMIFAGKAKGYEFCDFVTYVEMPQDFYVERVFANDEWQKKYIPMVHEYCTIYNKLLKKKQLKSS